MFYRFSFSTIPISDVIFVYSFIQLGPQLRLMGPRLVAWEILIVSKVLLASKVLEAARRFIRVTLLRTPPF